MVDLQIALGDVVVTRVVAPVPLQPAEVLVGRVLPGGAEDVLLQPALHGGDLRALGGRDAVGDAFDAVAFVALLDQVGHLQGLGVVFDHHHQVGDVGLVVPLLLGQRGDLREVRVAFALDEGRRQRGAEQPRTAGEQHRGEPQQKRRVQQQVGGALGDPAALHAAGGDQHQPVHPFGAARGEPGGDAAAVGEPHPARPRQFPVVQQFGQDGFQALLVGRSVPRAAAAVARQVGGEHPVGVAQRGDRPSPGERGGVEHGPVEQDHGGPGLPGPVVADGSVVGAEVVDGGGVEGHGRSPLTLGVRCRAGAALRRPGRRGRSRRRAARPRSRRRDRSRNRRRGVR